MDKSVLIIFGAGSEKALGFPTTQDIEKIFMQLLGIEDNKIDKNTELSVRLNKALKEYIGEYSKDLEGAYHIYKNLELTLRILIDGNGAKTTKDAAKDRQKAIDEFISLYKNFVKNNFKINQEEKFEENVYKIKYYLNLQPFSYDWVNMKALTYYLYKDQPNKFNLIDLLNISYNSRQSGISLVVPEYFNLNDDASYNQWYKCNIDGIFNVYKLILYKIYKGICYVNFSKEKYKTLLTYYYKFIKKFIDKYKDKVTFASFNWNPIMESLAYRICYRFNNEEQEHYRYIDHSALINMVNIDQGKGGRPKERPSFTRNTKYFLEKLCDNPKTITSIGFYPLHGTFNTRVCPKCSSVSMMHQTIQREFHIVEDLYDLFLVDPFPSLIDLKRYIRYPILRNKIKNGENFGEISCPKCGTPIGFTDTILEIQTIFKDYSHYSLKDMVYEFANKFSEADVIIILGYSFPSDDIKDLLFLKAFKDIRNHVEKRHQKIYVVNYHNEYKNSKVWMTLKEAKENFRYHNDEQIHMLIKNLEKLFHEDSVYLSFKGVPNIFVSDIKDVDIDVFDIQ